jgi:hypothetical protein
MEMVIEEIILQVAIVKAAQPRPVLKESAKRAFSEAGFQRSGLSAKRAFSEAGFQRN